MSEITIAITQMSCTCDTKENTAKAENLVRQAADEGADLVLLPELFETPYFCIDQDPKHFGRAHIADNNPLIPRFQKLAAELNVVLPVSYFERAGNARFNSVDLIDADGSIAGRYRKSHIPQNPGYEEKYYFSPGDTGFQALQTRIGRVGCGICWDQWFPETARAMALKGAEILLFPTAIGSEPSDPETDSAAHWRRVMQGHAGANFMPLAASNRVGTETSDDRSITFYGTSFIADHTGAIIVDMDRTEEGVTTASFDLDAIRSYRDDWGVFRDRRPDLYSAIGSLDAS